MLAKPVSCISSGGFHPPPRVTLTSSLRWPLFQKPYRLHLLLALLNWEIEVPRAVHWGLVDAAGRRAAGGAGASR